MDDILFILQSQNPENKKATGYWFEYFNSANYPEFDESVQDENN
jgi:hypothetical protein